MDYTTAQLESFFKRRTTYAKPFANVVKMLMQERIITDVTQEGESAYACNVDRRWNMNSLCREFASIIHNGVFSEIGHKEGVKWGMGNMTGGVLILREVLPEVKQSQAIVRAIIPASQMPPEAWTKGGNARILIRYALDKAVTGGANAEDLLAYSTDTDGEDIGERRYQYHDCIPGHYPKATMWDLEAFFFNLIRRLPCLHVHIHNAGRNGSAPSIDFGEWGDREGKRWLEIVKEIADTKILRNAVWGVLLGSSTSKITYSSAKKDGFPEGFVRQRFQGCKGSGLARAAGLLVARSASEICARGAQETSSIYSTMDAVTAQGNEIPAYWDSLGLAYRIKEKADMQTDGIGANIIARGVWQLGGHHTLFYYPDGPKVPDGYRPPFDPSPVSQIGYENEFHKLWI